MDDELPYPAWRKQNDGVLVAKQKALEHTARRRADRTARQKTVQLVVVAENKAFPHAIAGSGLAASMSQGMRLAERMANRFRQNALDNRLKVMVVDDVASVRNSLAAVLRDNGYEVAEATSAEGALRRLERIHRPVVLIAGINLGKGMNGLELADEVRELWPKVRTLLISSGDEKPLIANEATIAFIPKPMSTGRLLEQVAMMFACVQPTPAGD